MNINKLFLEYSTIIIGFYNSLRQVINTVFCNEFLVLEKLSCTVIMQIRSLLNGKLQCILAVLFWYYAEAKTFYHAILPRVLRFCPAKCQKLHITQSQSNTCSFSVQSLNTSFSMDVKILSQITVTKIYSI